MNDTIDGILKFCASSLSPADNAALKDMLNSSADGELSTQTALRALSFLRDKMDMSDISKLIDMLGAVTDYTPGEDDREIGQHDIENLPPPPAALTGGIPASERKAAGLAGQDDPPPFAGRPTVGGQDRRYRRRPRSWSQLAFDTVLKRGGNTATKVEADAAAYLRRFPEAARLGSPLPNYSQPKSARPPATTRAQDESYAERFADTKRIQH